MTDTITPWHERKLNYALEYPREAAMQAEIAQLRATLAQQAGQGIDDYMRGFNDGMKEAPTGECWIRAIDEAMVGAHIGVANIGDDYGTAKEKLNSLICWSVEVDRELSKPRQQAEQGWQPIETAPKDFVTSFDGWCGERVADITWAHPDYSAKGHYAFCISEYEQGFGHVTEVKGLTHWMPLPAAPKGAV